MEHPKHGFQCYLGIPSADLQGYYLRLKAGSNYFPIDEIQYEKVYSSDTGNIYHVLFTSAALYFLDVLAWYIANHDITVPEIQAMDEETVYNYCHENLLPVSHDRLEKRKGLMQDAEWLVKQYLLTVLEYDSSVYLGQTRQDIFDVYPSLEGTKTVEYTDPETGETVTREEPILSYHEWN